MQEWKKKLHIDNLDDPYYELAQRFGMDVALEIEELYRGKQVYFPSLMNATVEWRKDMVREEFTGYNSGELATKYGFSERYVREICKEKMEKLTKKPLDGQIDLFD